MDYERLNSEKVNYLIWRYLQEAGFGQCAARLQRDWGIQDPEQLYFAKHIEPRSLIRLLHNGLKLHRISNLDRPGGAVPYFGPEKQAASLTEASVTRQQPPSPTRKADGEALVNGLHPENAAPQAPTAKRGRRSNGTVNGKSKSGEGANLDENAHTPKVEHAQEISSEELTNKLAVADAGANAGSGDVDGAGGGSNQEANANANANGNANGIGNGLEGGASHLQLQEQQLMIPTLTNGISVGVQSEEVTDLTFETTVLSLAGKNVNHAAWNPNQRGILAAGGRALGRIWRIADSSRSGTDAPQATSPATSSSQSIPKALVSPEHTTDLDIDANSSVISLAWSSDGEIVAYSSFSDDVSATKRSQITIKNSFGLELDSFPCGIEPVTNLVWSPNGRYIAGLMGRAVVVYDGKTSSGIRPLESPTSLFDIAWIDHNQLIFCGESAIAVARISDNKIALVQEFSSLAQSHDWTNLRVDTLTSSVAIVSEQTCQLALIQNTTSYCEKAHESTITGLAYQPLHGRERIDPPEQRLLATASCDDTIKVWNTASGLQHIRTLEMGPSSPALAVSFSPDGQVLSGASAERILLWTVDNGVMPKAIWDLKRANSYSQLSNGFSHTNGANGYAHDVDMEDDSDEPPVLGWEKTGRYLSFANKDKIAVIAFQR